MNGDLIEKILSGEATVFEIENFKQWLSESDENREYYETLKVLWDKLGEVYLTTEFDKTAAKASIRLKIAEMQRNKRKKVTISWFATAASILLLIGLGIFYNQYKSQSNQIIVYSTGGVVKEIVLPDSSHIWLNVNSSLKSPVNFSKKQRKVTLKGEAYFEITRDVNRPFKITTGNTVTEVLGTTFNIMMDTLNGNVNVFVTSGKVAFYKEGQSTQKSILNPNDLGQYKELSQQIIKSTTSNKNFLSWKTGILTFSDTPLGEVCKELSRHYKKSIKVSDLIFDQSITGSFKDEKLEDILKTIEMTLNVKDTMNGSYIYIHK